VKTTSPGARRGWRAARFGSTPAKGRWLAAFVLGLALLSFAPAAPAQTGGRIEAIRVEGNQRVEAQTVLSYLTIAVGDLFDEERIDRSLKTLFSTGLFADVTITRDDNTLVVRVIENPIINRLAFEGNRHFDEDTLLTEVQLRPRKAFTRAAVQSDLQRMLQLYRRSGRFAATIEPKVIQLPQNRVDLVFEISEGPVTTISRIRFIGNRKYSDTRLRAEIMTKETRWYRFFTTDDIYDPDRVTNDRALLSNFYRSHGYADFRVVSAVAELTPERDAFFITFTLEEGEQYKFGKIDLRSAIKGVDAEKLRQVVTTKSEGLYDVSAIDKSVQNITFELGKEGFAFVDIDPDTERAEADRIIDLTYVINEAPRVYVERINISGNTRTLDRVIRRKIQLAEGDAFNTAKVRRSRNRIRALGFFEAVEIKESRGSAPDRVVLDVEVDEQPTGEFSFGAGYSTTDAGLVDLSLRERNLLGRGQDLRASVLLSSRRQQGDISFTEPYFLERELSAGVDFYHTRSDQQRRSGYVALSTGGGLRFGYPITDALSHVVRYSLRRDVIEEILPGASSVILAQAGSSVTSLVGHALAYEGRDDVLEPKSGFIARFGQDFAGVGGSERFVRHTASYSHFFGLLDQVVLRATASGGYIFGVDDDVNVINRFYLGGDSFRGFESRGIGPRDQASNDALGGNTFYMGTLEVTFPSGLPKEFGVSGRAFTEAGSLFGVDDDTPTVLDENTPRVSVGVGVTWKSPFGPIGVDISYPIVREDFDRDEIFHFNFGTRL
jgi:outer membrane protein insertion porin family